MSRHKVKNQLQDDKVSRFFTFILMCNKQMPRRRSKSVNSRNRRKSRRRSPKRDKIIHRSRSAQDKARKQNLWPRGCFLSNSDQYFVCKGKRATISCDLLRKVKARASRNGHKSVVAKAAFALKNRVCR